MLLEDQFYRRTDEMLHRLLEMSPGAATQLGEHRWDDRLGQRSAEALAGEHREMLGMAAELRAIDASRLGLGAQIDLNWSTACSARFCATMSRSRANCVTQWCTWTRRSAVL